MAYTSASGKAVTKYISKAYDQIVTRVPKGTRVRYKSHAEAQGKSLNAYIIYLIERDMQQAQTIACIEVE